MTNDEMAEHLRAAGWRVKEPLTQDNCEHRNTRGSASFGTGGSRSESWCHDCGKHWSYETPPTPQSWMATSLWN